MKVLDPGHRYLLRNLDGDGEQELVFVKREGEKYPGNVGAHEGVTMQECLRALIDRAKYVNKQEWSLGTVWAIGAMRAAMGHLEERAAQRAGRKTIPGYVIEKIEDHAVCFLCGHIRCEGQCRMK
jgi:hypothetical protein